MDHLMASIAVPMIFPPVLIEGEYFGDGAMRQATPTEPCSSHLGADRILVIGVRDETADKPPAPRPSRIRRQVSRRSLAICWTHCLWMACTRIWSG